MYKKNVRMFFLLFLIPFFLGFFIAHLKTAAASEDKRFESFALSLFQKELTANTLSLHYTLANPASYNIHTYPITFGALPSYEKNKANQQKDDLAALQQVFHTFAYHELSYENQLVYDILKLNLETESIWRSYPLLYEPLSPTLGIQAQLPILLAEYTFRTEQDIKDYLALLKELPNYFKKILAFEQQKSKQQLFMSDRTAKRILAQCQAFIQIPQSNYLSSVFKDKITSCTFLSKEKKKDYLSQNNASILNAVIPAYKLLCQGLTQLLGTGINPYGLFYYPNGKNYYLALVRSTTGIYDSIETITDRLYRQLHVEYLTLMRLLKVYPDLPNQCQDEHTAQQLDASASLMLSHLQKQMSYDFPQIQAPSYSIKYVHKDLEPYLSPAFYLTPPIDLQSPNTIYINPYAKQKGLSLYANSGFVEGWATYIESYAYQYAPVSNEISRYMSCNRSFYLCLYALLDIYIHYYGWTAKDSANYLHALGITDASSQEEIYQTLIEDPANYLKYCLGSLYIQDLKESMKEQKGNAFDTKEFHEQLLTIGPAPFPVLEKYLFSNY